MADVTVSGQRREMCRGSLQWTGTSSRRNTNNSLSDAGDSFNGICLTAVYIIAELGI